jgi:hypothetical protein
MADLIIKSNETEKKKYFLNKKNEMIIRVIKKNK